MASFSIGACGNSDEEEIQKAKLSEGCLINSDCRAPLACAFRRCHTACETTRDCVAPQLCVASDKPFSVCQLEDERQCTYHSECAGSQLCGVDGNCRDQCATSRDCLRDQVCTQGTCAEPSELLNGSLPPSPAATAVGGQVCTYNSECPGDLVCRAGVCGKECLDTKDCAPGYRCNAQNRCESPLQGSAGAGNLASGGSAGSGGGGMSGGNQNAGGSPLTSDGAGGMSAATGGSTATGGSGGAGPEVCPGAGWTRPCQACADGPVGVQACEQNQAGFAWGACIGGQASEACDGKDNDCDGTPDNGVGFECILGQTAQCSPGGNCASIQGSKSCIVVGNLCKYGACAAGLEICNGEDDDCNGTKDDGAGMTCILGSSPSACTISKNNCSQPGIPSCDAACHLKCAPAAEICDGIDNDCEGTIDVVPNGIQCKKDSTEPCMVQACNMTLTGSRTCSSGCAWGSCVVADACNDLDDSCDGRIDEGYKYVAGVSGVLLAGTYNNTGVASVLDGNTVWVGWTDAALGSDKLRVGKFDVATGSPQSLIADAGVGLSFGNYNPASGVKIGNDVWFAVMGANTTQIWVARASGGSPGVAPVLTTWQIAGLPASGGYYRLGALASDGTDLYITYRLATGPLRAARISTSTLLVTWDRELTPSEPAPAALAFEGSSLHAIWCDTAQAKLRHARLSTSDGVPTVASHIVVNSECTAPGKREAFVEYTNGALLTVARSATFTAQVATLSLTGVTQSTQSFAVPGQNALYFALRVGNTSAFAVGSEAGVRRYSQQGVLASSATEGPSLSTYSANGSLLYPAGGPVSIGVNPTNPAQIVMTRLQCP
ncbi:MAG: MopE-related protein [Polyangiaceae bacterium]|nr:MopE-related protein [Polyangiaceae bacterium]